MCRNNISCLKEKKISLIIVSTIVGYFNLIAIDVNVQVYTTSNKVMNIQDCLTGIDDT